MLEGAAKPGVTNPPPLARMVEQVAVVSGGASLDLGEHIALPFLSAGDAAPDFTAKVIGGDKISLSDLRGKYVLLDFWATWCAPCLDETPNLKQVHEDFGGDPEFKLVGLSLDAAQATPRSYAKKHGLKWVNGHLGSWIKQEVTKKFRIYELPQTLLVGPDGKIIAQNLRGDRIRAAVVKALRDKK